MTSPKGHNDVLVPQNEFRIPECGLVVLESRHAPDFSNQPRTDCFRFYLVIAGHAVCEVGGRRYLLGPDTLCHIPAGQAYRLEIRPNDPVLINLILYRSELLSSAVEGQLFALGMLPLNLGGANQGRAVRSIFQEMLYEQNSCHEGWELILRARLMELAVRTIRMARRRGRNETPVFEGKDSTERVARYALHLKSQFLGRESIAEAAHAVGLSRRQFTELFRKVTGQSWRHYVLELRLQHAVRLLVETDRPILEAALDSGFEDLSHFHHCFKSAHGCSPLKYREQHQIRVPIESRLVPEPLRDDHAAPGFKLRGMKGWFWTADQYLEEIQVLSSLKMNFLMDCYGSMIVSESGGPWCNEWWKSMTEVRKEEYGRIIQACRENGISFCFALHPQLASPRPLDPANPRDLDQFYQHYAWAQSQGVRWFSICLDGTSWGPAGPAACGESHSRFVNDMLERLQANDPDVQLLFCPVACWADGTNPEHRAYLESLARDLNADVYIFWNGDGIVTPRITRVAAENYRSIVKHRLFLWDNYPVNDGSPTLHLGPLSGRDPDLCDVIDGYLSNPMCTQNQINRLPLATCADYAYNPWAYKPSRSIGQSILRFGSNGEQQRVLKDLVEAYPGFIVAGGGTGTNPVRGKFAALLSGRESRAAALELIKHMDDILARLAASFPQKYPATRKTVEEDIQWMKKQLNGK